MSLESLPRDNNTRRQQELPQHIGRSALTLLGGSGDQDLSDARITAADRRFVRRLVAVADKVLSEEGLLYLAGGAEDAAWRKRAAEEGRRA
jgi:hypothetical protein